MNKTNEQLDKLENNTINDVDEMFLECINDLNNRVNELEIPQRGYKYKQLLLGVATGITGLGLQNLNPFEPIAITHFHSIILGFCVFIITLIIIPMIKLAIMKFKRGLKDEQC